MGGKGSIAQPPPSNWTSLAEMQLQRQLADTQTQAQLMIYQMQANYESQLAALTQESILPEAPEITEYDIDWSETIDEMESIAYEEIAKLTEVGPASGTILTSPLVWDEEPNVLSNLLSGS